MDDEQWYGRPTRVWVLILLDLTAVALALYGALAPRSPASPTTLNAAAAVLAAGFAGMLLWRGASVWLQHANLVVYLAGTTALVAAAATGEGALSVAFTYLLVTMYVAVFLPAATARGYVAAAVLGLGVGLSLNPTIGWSLAIWLPPALSCLTSGAVLSRLVERLHAASSIDPLTRLPNRSGFAVAARREMAVAARTGAPLTVAVVDLDDFKSVNDAGGHATGDRVLVDLAAGWRGALRPRDVVARYGGDEFVFLLPETSERDATALMTRLRAISTTGWSHGVAAVTSVDGLEEALHVADARLYRTKQDREPPHPTSAELTV